MPSYEVIDLDEESSLEHPGAALRPFRQLTKAGVSDSPESVPLEGAAEEVKSDEALAPTAKVPGTIGGATHESSQSTSNLSESSLTVANWSEGQNRKESSAEVPVPTYQQHSSTEPRLPTCTVDLTDDDCLPVMDPSSSRCSLPPRPDDPAVVTDPEKPSDQIDPCEPEEPPRRSQEVREGDLGRLTATIPDEGSDVINEAFAMNVPHRAQVLGVEESLTQSKATHIYPQDTQHASSVASSVFHNPEVPSLLPAGLIIDLEEKSQTLLEPLENGPKSDETSQAVIDLADEDSTEDDKEEVITEEELDSWLKSQSEGRTRINRYGTLQSASVTSLPKAPTRNLSIELPSKALDVFDHHGIVLRPGVNVELQDRTFVSELEPAKMSQSHNSFMRIVDIIQDTSSQAVTLRGWLFQRAQYLNGILERKKNELCWLLHVDDDDSRDVKTQGMVTVPVEDVLKRRKIRLTNQPWPNLSFRDDADEDTEDVIRNERVLVCRFMYICYYASADRRDANIWSERVLQYLRACDCDKWSGPRGEPCALDDAELRTAWRGETIPGGAFLPAPKIEPHDVVDLSSQPVINLEEETIKSDPDIIVLEKDLLVDDDQPVVTNVFTRVDWRTTDGTEYYTINGFVPAKRPAEDSSSLQPRKRHRAETPTSTTRQRPERKSLPIRQHRNNSIIDLEKPDGAHQSPQGQTDDRKPVAVNEQAKVTAKKQYNFGDSFCGAGGMSRAAVAAGLHIEYAFDCNKHACTSYSLNFPDARLHCLWAHDFVSLPEDYKVDIAHLSPPCQFFSDAHTVAGKDDEMNTASLFAVGELLAKSKPRVVTLEQTFGIVMRAKHQGYLNALVQVFTSRGFSIRWRLLHCADYGLPQMRLRTFMIASCPGQALPPFPKPTHSSSPMVTGLLPWTTINKALSSVTPYAANHDLEKCKPRTQLPKCGDTIAKTVTCNGGGQVHPNGKRDLTIREFAALQGFPAKHIFGNVGAKKQIGNAVPPVVGRKVLESVVRFLEKEDGVRS
ncbi:MAG: hypothetical protein Q9174_002440 [Haloplaca sp. 1 TL-2023]